MTQVVEILFLCLSLCLTLLLWFPLGSAVALFDSLSLSFLTIRGDSVCRSPFFVDSSWGLISCFCSPVSWQHALYRGTLDAFYKIARYEGFRALYKGFLPATLGIGAGQMYVVIW